MRAPGDGIGILCNRIHDGVQHGVDNAVGESLWVVLAVEERAICFRSRNSSWIAHIMLERIVDVEVDIVHRGDGSLEGGRFSGGSISQSRKK